MHKYFVAYVNSAKIFPKPYSQAALLQFLYGRTNSNAIKRELFYRFYRISSDDGLDDELDGFFRSMSECFGRFG